MAKETLIVNNFSGKLTRYRHGDLNSGFAYYNTTWGVNVFENPMNLKFQEQARDIGGSVVTDLIVAGKTRLENSVTYVYAIGHLKRLYKIQVNDPNNENPNYDTPVLLATLSGSYTFQQGGSIEFYGSTEKIFIGCDQGVVKINFDGTGETFVGVTSSTQWIANVPRQSVQFQGKIYYTNGSNLAEIDSTETVTTYTKLSPSLPDSMQARDVDVTSDGTYLVATVTEIPLTSILNTQPDANVISNGGSLVAYWNGTDGGVTRYITVPSFAQTAYQTFADKEYAFGYDIVGGSVSDPAQKKLTVVFAQSPLPNAVGANGNIVGWWAPEFNQGFLVGSLFLYGNLDEEFQPAFYRQHRQSASLGGGDVLRVPWNSFVTNFGFGGITSGYTGNVIGIGKLYFSTLEYNGSTTAYKLYAYNEVATGQLTAVQGVYETQVQLFSKKKKISQVRLYSYPLVSGNSFTIEPIGVDGNALSGGSITFTAGSNADVGETVSVYTPNTQPTAGLGFRITNAGAVTPTIVKLEVDVVDFGI